MESEIHCGASAGSGEGDKEMHCEEEKGKWNDRKPLVTRGNRHNGVTPRGESAISSL